MMAARPFRWLLSLLALLAPVTATPNGPAPDDAPVSRGDDHVVFRHYL